MPEFRYHSVDPPTRWPASHVSEGETKRDLFFDCADCGAKGPPIAGMLGTGPSFSGVGLLGSTETGDLRPAMFCADCFAKRLAAVPKEA